MNRVLKRIAYDEDGVALAFGIAFFLLIFLLGMSVYAAGESVRQRMELQYAADAAAYHTDLFEAFHLRRLTERTDKIRNIIALLYRMQHFCRFTCRVNHHGYGSFLSVVTCYRYRNTFSLFI